MSYLEEAKDELKRADHLVFISLKYTRTCDIIKNTIERIINAYEFIIFASLEGAKDRKKISDIPTSKIERANALLKLKRNIKKDISEYLLLIDILNAKFERREEYRKNVTMISKLDKNDLEVNVPALMNYFENVKAFYYTMVEWIND